MTGLLVGIIIKMWKGAMANAGIQSLSQSLQGDLPPIASQKAEHIVLKISPIHHNQRIVVQNMFRECQV